MSIKQLSKRSIYFSIGAIGLSISIIYLMLAFQLPFGQLDEPGAAIFPVAVGSIIFLASFAILIEAKNIKKEACIEMPDGRNRNRVLNVTFSILFFLVALPWLGYLASSFIFFVAIIKILSNDSTKTQVIGYSLVMSCTIYCIFVLLLKVQMPSGIIEF